MNVMKHVMNIMEDIMSIMIVIKLIMRFFSVYYKSIKYVLRSLWTLSNSSWPAWCSFLIARSWGTAWPRERRLGSIDELLEIGSPDNTLFEKRRSRNLQCGSRPQPNAERQCHVVGSKSKGSIARTFWRARARAHCRRRRRRASARARAPRRRSRRNLFTNTRLRVELRRR